MLRDHRSIAAAAAKEKEDYTAFLLRMCERECLEREQRAAQRRIKAAGFPVIKTLDTFDFAAQPTINKALVLELMRGEYLDARENILFVGNPGTGKTHLATALGHAACAQGKRVRYYSVTSLVTQLLEAREDRQLDRLLRRLEKNHLLILDEFGYVPFTKAGAELLFEVAGRAYERQSLILTTNLPFEQWTEILGNERLTGALLDRVTHRVHILEANGESFRLRQAKQRAKRAK
jgi:DNA replication protein DnaC